LGVVVCCSPFVETVCIEVEYGYMRARGRRTHDDAKHKTKYYRAECEDERVPVNMQMVIKESRKRI